MARKKYHEEKDDHDRWLVSYADFMTLLFAFFVVMYALSSINEGKYRVLSNALTGAFGKIVPSTGKIPDAPDALEAQTFKLKSIPILKQKNQEILHKEREKMTAIARDILAVLEPLVREGKVQVAQTSRGVTIEINASVLFAPGEAKLNDFSAQALKAIAAVLANDNHDLQIEGHTDNIPISNASFPSNWELSAVRATTVARLFAENGVDEKRMTAVGQGAKLPVGSNETLEGRAKNRRVTVTILALLPEQAIDVPVKGTH
jgi:chemotaxis protein MotB